MSRYRLDCTTVIDFHHNCYRPFNDEFKRFYAIGCTVNITNDIAMEYTRDNLEIDFLTLKCFI